MLRAREKWNSQPQLLLDSAKRPLYLPMSDGLLSQAINCMGRIRVEASHGINCNPPERERAYIRYARREIRKIDNIRVESLRPLHTSWKDSDRRSRV